MIGPEYLGGLLVAYGIVGINLCSPGPNILAVIGTSMATGRRDGVALALGVAAGTFCWATLTVLGLSALLTIYAGAMLALKIVGAAYLLWLAFKAFRSAARPGDPRVRAVAAASPWRMFWRGLAVQMTNPKAALAWVAIVAIGIGANAPLAVSAALVLGATAMSLLGHLVYAVAFSTPPVVTAYVRARRFVEAGLGAFFTFAAFKLATSRS